MAKKTAASIQIVACTFSKGKVLKYQAIGSYKGKRIVGDPGSSRSIAIRSLLKECDKFAGMTAELRDQAIQMLDVEDGNNK
jgi:hypothetical protein|nr:hypothetical protein [uncultured Prevotella sp.]